MDIKVGLKYIDILNMFVNKFKSIQKDLVFAKIESMELPKDINELT